MKAVDQETGEDLTKKQQPQGQEIAQSQAG
jgi:hypothetical protein